MVRRSSIALLALLGISLALNFFVFGFLAAGAWHHPHFRGDRLARYAAISGLGRAPGPLRDRVENALRQQRPELRQALEAVRQARGDVRAAMRAEPFDRAKLDAAFAALRARADALQTVIYGAVGNAVAAAPAAERAAIRPPRHED